MTYPESPANVGEKRSPIPRQTRLAPEVYASGQRLSFATVRLLVAQFCRKRNLVKDCFCDVCLIEDARFVQLSFGVSKITGKAPCSSGKPAV
jgi:hypothetical protein